MPTFEAMKAGYANLWSRCQITASRSSEVDKAVSKIATGIEKYRAVERKTGVPWYWIGAVHLRESSCNFSRHLHNGDPLTARTKLVPKGRPANGSPPFSWEESAIDALTMEGKELDKISNWSIPRCLYEWEKYNGTGYQARGVNSPYVWGATSNQQPGKYIADHVWSPTAWDSQLGCAAVLKRMIERGVTDLKPPPRPAPKIGPVQKTVIAGGAAAAAAASTGYEWLIVAVGVIAVAGIAYFIWKNRSAE